MEVGSKNSPPTFLILTTEFKNIAQSHKRWRTKSSMLVALLF